MNEKIKADFDKLILSGVTVMLHFDGTHPGCIIPKSEQNQLSCFAYEEFSSHPYCSMSTSSCGVHATLGFNAYPTPTSVPWDAVYAITSDNLVLGYRPIAQPSGNVVSLNVIKPSSNRPINKQSSDKAVLELKAIRTAVEQCEYETPVNAEFLQELKRLNSTVARHLKADVPKKDKPA